MKIFDKLKSALSNTKKSVSNKSGDSATGQFDKEFQSYFDSEIASIKKLKKSYHWLEIKDLKEITTTYKSFDDDQKTNFILFLFKRIKSKKIFGFNMYGDLELNMLNIIASYVFKVKLNFNDDRLEQILNQFCKPSFKESFFNFSHILFLNQLIKQNKTKPLSEIQIKLIGNYKNYIAKKVNDSYHENDKKKILDRIDTLLRKEEDWNMRTVYFSNNDKLGVYANSRIAEINDEKLKSTWYRVIAKAQTVKAGKPTKKYLDEAQNLIKLIGSDNFKKTCNHFFIFVNELKEDIVQKRVAYGDGSTYEYSEHSFLDASNSNAIKGLIWMCAHFHDSKTIVNLSNLAQRSYKKVPGHGPIAAAIGNACFFTLYKSKGLAGVGQLSRLKTKIKQPSAIKIIDNYLTLAAKEKGISINEIEDLSVPDFNLQRGKLDLKFNDYTCVLEISKPGRSEIKWFKPDGKPQKTVPSIVKTKFGERLKKLKATKKQIDQTTSAQKQRLDRSLKYDRKIEFETFEKLYLNHGLMCSLTNKLIWNFEHDHKITTAIYQNENWINFGNDKVKINKDCKVSLWHPASANVNTIEDWRNFLIENEITQPFKQAFREVYLLTDAELNTKSYSNRMAAHILKQHQFVNLAKARTWKATLLGAWDGGYEDLATIALSEYNLKAEFWIQSVDSENAFNDTGIWDYVSTDQLRFINTETNVTVDLIDIPPILFSEIMRDTDLFVGVASVGNDPTWNDSGGLPQYRTYWENYSFGNLSELAKNRKGILENLVPRLKIREVASFEDKFLVIKGKLRTYKIHIGSTNILMKPNDQYLCIVPDRKKKEYSNNLFIPYEGDSALSVILSKAFLLADDDKITDTTITSQISKR